MGSSEINGLFKEIHYILKHYKLFPFSSLDDKLSLILLKIIYHSARLERKNRKDLKVYREIVENEFREDYQY